LTNSFKTPVGGAAAVFLLVALSALALLVSCASKVQQQQAPHAHIGASDVEFRRIYSSVQRPRSPHELLQNIKIAAHQELLFREDFYSDQNLQRFFGAETITWRDLGNPNIKSLFASNFGGISEPHRTGTLIIESISLSVTRITTAAGTEVTLRLLVGDARLTFETVEQILGPGWRAPRSLSVSEVHQRSKEPPSTSSHGNSRIEYDLGNGPFRSLLKLRFGARGTLETLILEQAAS
jgi:hypothetical protein